MEKNISKAVDLMNYELTSSNSTNYGLDQASSSPQSFPAQMENGILVQYESVIFSSELLEDTIELDKKASSIANNY